MVDEQCLEPKNEAPSSLQSDSGAAKGKNRALSYLVKGAIIFPWSLLIGFVVAKCSPDKEQEAESAQPMPKVEEHCSEDKKTTQFVDAVLQQRMNKEGMNNARR